MQRFQDISPCRDAVLEARQRRLTIGLVPTMGALHAGHASLIMASRQRCDRTVVTIFVNPTQFGPNEDYLRYPKPIDADLALCQAEGVDMVFQPSADAMYSTGSPTSIHVGELTSTLCGPHRPGHFDGVATVVAKLFNIVPAHVAFFGEKDYQQLMVVRRMVRDLNMPIEIVGCPTVRDPDGLAMSSRNAYLCPGDRRQALSLSRALFAARDAIGSGRRDVAAIVSQMHRTILDAGPASIDYVEIVDALTLQPLSTVDRPARICLAVWIGSCRLIDNVGVDAPVSPG